MISTVICDLDGLLADTEPLHYQAYRDVLAGFGVDLAEKDYAEHWIRSGLGIREFGKRRGITLDVDAVRCAKAERYDALVRTCVEPMPGALALLRALRERVILALASASYPQAAHAVLQALRIESWFRVIATRADVERVKPAPDLFLFVARALGVDPAACVVLEDAEKGVRAARRAGMHCIAVPTSHTRDNDFRDATLVVSSLTEVTPELLAAVAEPSAAARPRQEQ